MQIAASTWAAILIGNSCPVGQPFGAVGLFSSMTEERVVIQQWLEEHNAIRPYGSLAGMNPEQFLQRWIEEKMNQQPKTLTA